MELLMEKGFYSCQMELFMKGTENLINKMAGEWR